MVDLVLTPQFLKWFEGLRDVRAQAKIQVRLDRIRGGLLGDVKPVGGGVSELRIDHGPGYRIYLYQRGNILVVVLGGGTKRHQDRDIQAALDLARRI